MTYLVDLRGEHCKAAHQFQKRNTRHRKRSGDEILTPSPETGCVKSAVATRFKKGAVVPPSCCSFIPKHVTDIEAALKSLTD